MWQSNALEFCQHLAVSTSAQAPTVLIQWLGIEHSVYTLLDLAFRDLPGPLLRYKRIMENTLLIIFL